MRTPLNSGCPKRTDIDTDCHTGDQHIVAAGTEERGFGFVQTDSMDERADQIFAETMFFQNKRGLERRFPFRFCRQPASLWSRQNASRRYFMHSCCFRGVLARHRKRVAHNPGVTVDFRSKPDHDQFAVCDFFGTGGRHHRVGARAAADYRAETETAGAAAAGGIFARGPLSGFPTPRPSWPLSSRRNK